MKVCSANDLRFFFLWVQDMTDTTKFLADDALLRVYLCIGLQMNLYLSRIGMEEQSCRSSLDLSLLLSHHVLLCYGRYNV